MSEPSILLCGPALDADESAVLLDVLRQVTLPNATKFVATTAKFDAQGVAKTVNVESDYPAELAYLHTLRKWSQIFDVADPRFRDGYDLYCLRRILARQRGSDYAMVLRGAVAPLEARWPQLQRAVEGSLFVTFDERSAVGSSAAPTASFLIDLRDERVGAFLDAAMQKYLTGAVYGLTDYSLNRVLSIALASIQLERSVRDRHEQAIVDPQISADTSADAKDEDLVDGEAE